VTPVCPAGSLPFVENNCWGTCVPATECRAVTSCDRCDPKTQACVTKTLPNVAIVHCVPLPKACNQTPSCACLGSSVCGAGSCAETMNGLACSGG
jgi:hypothetical protein